MAATIQHAFVSTIGDDPVAAAAGQVVPSNWNAAHSISGGVAGGHLMLDAASALQTIVMKGFLFGLALSTAGASATFSVAAGVAAADQASGDFMVLAAALSKTTSAWAVGSGNGGLDTGAIAANTFYHAHLIKRMDTGVVDALVSLSPTAPTLPANYTLSRRLGSLQTNASSQWYLFSQNGDEFLWDVPRGDAAASNPGTAAVLRTLSVPTGIKVTAIIAVAGQSNSTNTDSRAYISSPDVSDQVPASSNLNAGMSNPSTTVVASVFSQMRIRTNTSAQIRTRNLASDAGTTIVVSTHGWLDRRGQDS